MLRTIVIAAAAAGALASCPNSCSGHGVCGGNDICECYDNFMGADCSLLRCPSANSWALDSANPHDYEECSGAGICNRATGTCNCFPGHTGSSCQRRTCPNDCSGHGECKMLGEVPTTVALAADAWEATAIQACVCDAGFFGTDCSQQYCPTGDDPLTLCNSKQKFQTQQVRVTLGSKLNHAVATGVSNGAADEGMALFGTSDSVTFDQARQSVASGQMTLGYQDPFGDVYPSVTTAKAVFSKAVGGVDPGVDSVQVALEAVPNRKVGNVSVVAAANTDLPTDVLGRRLLVKFNSETNIGLQAPLTCGMKACPHAGCAPMVKPAFLYRYAATDAERPSFDSPFAPGALAFQYYTGQHNAAADFTAKKFVRLASTSIPQLPLGVAADTGVSSTSVNRYDVRIVVAVQGPSDALTADDAADVYWVKVVYGHTNITTDVFEYDDGVTAGVWSVSKQARFTGTLLGFNYMGYIPASLKATLPDFPGIELDFPSRNMVSTNTAFRFRFFEILVKLSTCDVTAMMTGSEFKDANGAAIAPVDLNVENVECSNRGQCNRATGQCECFAGFHGRQCSTMTSLV